MTSKIPKDSEVGENKTARPSKQLKADPNTPQPQESLDYEDVYEDEFEEEIEGESEEEEEEDVEKENGKRKTVMFQEGVDELAEDEQMEHDNSAYLMLQQLRLPQSCYCFDFLSDDLGAYRTQFPQRLSLIAGTQHLNSRENYLHIIHASQLHKTKKDRMNLDSDDDSDSDDDNLDDDAVVVSKEIRHLGCVNRVKAMPQNNSVVATWSDAGSVYVFDVAPKLKTLHKESFSSVKGVTGYNNENVSPFYCFKDHGAEGYALNFSEVSAGVFASGGCDSSIFVHSLQSDGRVVSNRNPFSSHTDSVEDIEFSPSEATVFCSCSVDKTVRIFDTRAPSQASMLDFVAHDSDVNVISWNKQVKYLLASGADDGDIKVWDLRMVKKENKGEQQNVGYFTYHKRPITGISWDFEDDSVLTVSSDDNTVTVWDLALEEEDDGLADINNGMSSMKIRDKDGNEIKLPPQLLFIHAGIEQPKQVNFHKQIPGLIGAASVDSLHLFICEPLEHTPKKK